VILCLSVCEFFAWQPPSETYPNTFMLQKVIELVEDGYKMRFRLFHWDSSLWQ
jgi:hypothetical protein